MELTENVNDRNRIEGMDTDVAITITTSGANNDDALEVLERLEAAVKEKIEAAGEGLAK